MGEPARLRLKVRHHEVDLYGHVNHAHYVHYLEAGRVEALEALGLGLVEMRRHGYLIVAADLSIKFHAPAHPGDTLDVITHIREIRGARSLWVQEIREASTQRLLVTAEVTGAFMAESGRPIRASATIREKLAALYVPATRTPPPPAGPESSPAGDSLAIAPPRGADPREVAPSSRKARPWCLCHGGPLSQRLREIARIG